MAKPYRRCMAGGEGFTPRRAVSVEEDLWSDYGKLVGDRNRSADIRRYIEWRLSHPHDPLPGLRVIRYPGAPPKSE